MGGHLVWDASLKRRRECVCAQLRRRRVRVRVRGRVRVRVRVRVSLHAGQQKPLMERAAQPVCRLGRHKSLGRHRFLEVGLP